MRAWWRGADLCLMKEKLADKQQRMQEEWRLVVK